MARWRNKLKDKYLRERKKIRFGKGNQAIADIDDIFVDLSIFINRSNVNIPYVRKDIKCTTGSHQNYRMLESYVDLIRLKTDRNEPFCHILVRGVAGSGKTTLLSRIACDWARAVDNNDTYQSTPSASNASDESWAKFKLLFLLDVKKIKADTSLEQTIRNQLLPGVPVESIEGVMSKLGGSCLVLLDGFDEIQAGVDADDSALCSPLLDTCFVIVTSRPHMVDHFCQISSGYAVIQLSGFSLQNSILYITRFFRTQEDLGSKFIEKVKATPLLIALSSFPILLVMMCILWENSQKKETAFKSLTGLYQQAMVYLNKPFGRPGSFIDNIDSILEILGKPALTSLFNKSLQIGKSDFDDDTILKKAFLVGLVYEEECSGDTVVYFIHKTFQEFCSAKYLASLAESDCSLFESHLRNIDENNVLAMLYLLQFTCGLNSKAAVMIFSHVVELSSKEWFLPLRLLYEMETNGLQLSDSQQMHNVLEQLSDHDLSLSSWDGELFYILSHFIESDTHSPNVWLRYVKCLSIRMGDLEVSMLCKYLEHMDSLEKLSISSVKFIGAFDTGLRCYKTMRKVNLSYCTVPTMMVLRMLSCMPALQQVEIDSVHLEGSLDPVVTIQCESIEKFHISKGSIDANTVLRLLSYLPIREIGLWHTTLIGETNIGESLRFPTTHRFSMTYEDSHTFSRTYEDPFGDSSKSEVKPSPSTVLKLFAHMDSLKELTLHNVDISGQLTTQMNGLIQLRIVSSMFGEHCKVNAKTFMSFISNMPQIESISLEYASIVGDLQDSDAVISPMACNVQMNNVQGSACTLVILLCSMKMVREVSLRSFQLSGKFDPLISISAEYYSKHTIKLNPMTTYDYLFGRNDLQGRVSKVNALALLNHLHRIRSMDEVELDRISITGALQADGRVICSQFKSFSMKSGTISTETMIQILGRMPSLEKVHLDDVSFTDEETLGENSTALKSLRVANIGTVKNARTLLAFIACMPALERLTTTGFFSGEVEDCTPVTCESLENLRLAGIPRYIFDEDQPDTYTTYEVRMRTIPSTVLASILQCMPSLKMLSLQSVELAGNVGARFPSINLSQLQSFDMVWCEICADMLMTLLCSSPVLQRVVVYQVNIIGELSAKSIKSCPSIIEFDMSSSTVDVNTLLMFLGCMPSLKRVVLGKVLNLSSSQTPEECRSIETFRMNNVTIDANVLMTLLSQMPSLVKVALDNMIITGEFQNAFECKSVVQFTKEGGSVSPKTLLHLWGSMLQLKQVVLKKVEIKKELLENIEVCCNELKTLYMLDMELTVSTFARILHSTPSLATVYVSGIKGDLEPGISVSCSKLQVMKILSGELDVSTLAGLLSFMPSLQAIVCENVNMIGDTNVSVSLRCITVLALAKCTIDVKIVCKLLSFMPSLKSVGLNKVTLLGGETRRLTARFKCLGEIQVSDMSLKVSFLSQLLTPMPSLQKIVFETITFEHDADMSISTIFKDLVEFTIKKSTVSALILQKFLKCMPLLSTLNLDGVSITGEMDPTLHVTCQSVFNFKISGKWMENTILNANTLSHILACLPSLQSVYLNKIHIQLATENFMTSIGKSVKTMHICDGKVEPNALLRIMSCMSVLETVAFEHMIFTSDVDSTLDYQCSVINMKFSRMFESLRMTILLGFLNHMPLLETILIDQLDLTGDFDLKNIQQCRNLKVAVFCGYSTSKIRFNIETLIRFLAHCAPSIERVDLDKVEHIGEFDGLLSATCTTLKELSICSHYSSTSWTISINALVKALHCLPSLQVLNLGPLDITGDFDTSIPRLESRIKTFQMSGGSLSSSVLAVLLDFFPVLESMAGVKLTDQEDSVENVCKSLKALDLSASTDITIEANTAIGFVGAMPALEDLKLEKIDSESTVHDNILVNGNSVKSVHLKKCSFTANAVIRLLRHMERLERISLDDVNISNDADTEMTVTCQFVEEFDMKSGSISAGAVFKLLCCMPQIHKLSLCNVTDEANDRTVECKALRKLTVSNSDVTACTMTMLIQCMPSLQTIVMHNVNVAGQVDLDVAYELRFVRTYEMNESTISADALLVFLQHMPALKTVKLCAVQITGKLCESHIAPCKSVYSFSLSGSMRPQYSIEKQTCNVNATALFVLLGCMVDLEELNLEEVEVLGELNAEIQIQCNKLRKIMMKGGSVSANAIMTFLRNMQAVRTVTLGSTVGEVEIDLNSSATLMLAKELVLEQGKNAGLFSGEKLIRFLRIMPALRKVSIRVPELGDIETGDDVKCENVQELEIAVSSTNMLTFHRPSSRLCTIGANTVLKFSDLFPHLETLLFKQVDIICDLQAGTCHSYDMLTDLLMIAVSITADSLLLFLQKMPALQRLSLVKMKLVGVVESSTPVTFKSLRALKLSGNHTPLKVGAKMLAMMPSLVILRIDKFEMTGDFDCSTVTLGTSLMEVQLTDGTVETVSFFQYLLSLPSLKKLYLSKIGRVFLPVSIRSKSLQEFTLRLSNTSALVQFLQHMPCVRKVEAAISLDDHERTFPLHVKFSAVKEFSFTPITSDVNVNTIAQFLHCMPSLEKVIFHMIDISGDLPVSNVLNWNSLKEFCMLWNSSGKANTIMRLLHKMPALELLRLQNIKGTLDITEIGKWKSLKTFLLFGLTVSADTFLKLLGSMPVLEVLAAVQVIFDGDVGTSFLLNSIQEFTMTAGKTKVTTWVSVVECMPALTKLTLDDVQVDGNLDESCSEFGDPLAELSLVNMTLELSTCLSLLRRVKAKTVSLQKVKLKGKVYGDQCSVCQSVKELQVNNHGEPMDENMPLLLMNYMPSLEKVSLERTYCGKIDVDIHPQCKELKEFSLCDASMDTNSVVHYVNCMPALKKISLGNLRGDLDGSTEITCQSITEFSTSISNTCSVRFLEAFLARQQNLTKLKLTHSCYNSQLSTSDKECLLTVVNSVSSNLKVLELNGITPVNDVNNLPDCLTALLVARLPNLQELHLPNTNMTQMQCDKFLEILISTTGTTVEQIHSRVLPLQWLDLSSSLISNSAGKLAQVLAYLGNLRGLILCNSSLDEQHCQELSPSIASLNRLVALDLSDNKGASSILAADLRCLKYIQVLKLGGTGLGDEDLTHLPLAQMCGLTELDLSNNPFGNDGVETLMDSVCQEAHFSIDEDIDSTESSSDSYNDDSDSDDSFVSAVSHQSDTTQRYCTLKKLSFRDCTTISAKGVERVFREVSRFPVLEELDMGGIKLPTYECVHMPRLCKYLKAAGCTITDEETNLFHEEYLYSYSENEIKSIMNCLSEK